MLGRLRDVPWICPAIWWPPGKIPWKSSQEIIETQHDQPIDDSFAVRCLGWWQSIIQQRPERNSIDVPRDEDLELIHHFGMACTNNVCHVQTPGRWNTSSRSENEKKRGWLMLRSGSTWHWPATTLNLPAHGNLAIPKTPIWRVLPTSCSFIRAKWVSIGAMIATMVRIKGRQKAKAISYPCLFQRRCVFIKQLPFPFNHIGSWNPSTPHRLLPKVGPI